MASFIGVLLLNDELAVLSIVLKQRVISNFNFVFHFFWIYLKIKQIAY